MEAASKAASAATYAASGGALIFGFSVNEFAAIVGATVAILTFFVNLWFKYQHLELARHGKENPDESDG